LRIIGGQRGPLGKVRKNARSKKGENRREDGTEDKRRKNSFETRTTPRFTFPHQGGKSLNEKSSRVEVSKKRGRVQDWSELVNPEKKIVNDVRFEISTRKVQRLGLLRSAGEERVAIWSLGEN